MRPRRRVTNSVVLLLALSAVATSCRLAPYEPGPVLNRPEWRVQGKQTLADAYPKEYTLKQRVRLNVRGRELEFIGYLAVRRPGEYRAVAVSEMGNTLFDLMMRNGRPLVLQAPPSMPRKPLREGVMRDLSHLFDPNIEGTVQVHASPNGRYALAGRNRDGTIVRYAFGPRGRMIVSSLEASHGEVRRRATYEDYAIRKGWDRPLPGSITLRNRRWGYSMQIELLEFDPNPDLSRAFETQQ